MATTSLDGQTSCPCLIKLFYRTGAFHRPDEFAARQLPFVAAYASPTCSLDELACHLAAADETILPSPSVGTRVVFRLLFVDTRGATESSGPRDGPTRFAIKDLGSVVLGDLAGDEADDRHKTLADARFVVGDYISCAILPPLADGSAPPVAAARSGRGSGIGEGRTSALPPGGRGGGRRDEYRGWKRGGGGGGGSGGSTGLDTWAEPRAGHVEWRRGEPVPDGPWSRGGRGRSGRW